MSSLSKLGKDKKHPSPGGLEPPTFRLTVERADQLRHGDMCKQLHVIAYQRDDIRNEITVDKIVRVTQMSFCL